ncbi:hypothetical protein ACVWXM_006564 [Bradyrhizobium sp. GM7.3]
MLEIAHEHRGAARRKRTIESAFGANAGGLERTSGGAGDVGRGAASVGGHSRRIATREVRRDVREAAGQISITCRWKTWRSRKASWTRRRRSRGCDQGPIAERAGSRFSSQSRLPACPFAAGGTDHRACEYALPVRLRRHDEDRRGRQPAPRRDPGAMARADHTPPKIHLSPLLRPRRAGARTGARRARRAADRSGHRARDRLQIWRPYAILPSGRDLCAPGHPA